MSEMKRVMITGASTGIGYASAKYLADKGWRVYAGVRKPEDAERLSAARLIIVGEDEWVQGNVRVKTLATREEADIPLDEL